jgi:aspartate-semialdehyde dehydrogenase
LTLALKPIYEKYGLEAVHVTTMQAVSGAGYPGLPSLDILDNIIPFIHDEEQKIESEPLKILGNLKEDKIKDASIKMSVQVNRVPVTDGHMACVSLKVSQKTSEKEIFEAWNNFQGEVKDLSLPSSPSRLIYYFNEDYLPQTKLQRGLGKGMSISIGRLRPCPILDFKFVLLSHNTIRGGAGGAILTAELLVRKGFVFW